MYDIPTYDDFRRLALDDTLSDDEKMGVNNGARANTETAIVRDIESKLPALAGEGRTIIDIGSGCGAVARALIAACAERRHRLVLVDAPEILRLLDAPANVELRPHRFPSDPAFLDEYRGLGDAVILYSVLQIEFKSGDAWRMVDAVCELIAPGGRALVGDIPNRSMRRRLFESEAGKAFHRAYAGDDSEPPIPPRGLAPGTIDDAAVLGFLMRARDQGFNAFVMPQPPDLPFFNRREDIVVERY